MYAVAASGSLGRCHYVKGKFIASNLCLILRPKNNQDYPVNLLFYSLYLNYLKDRIRNDIADGTSKLTIAAADLNDYYIEYIPKNIQDKIADRYIKNVQSVKNTLRKATDAGSMSM